MKLAKQTSRVGKNKTGSANTKGSNDTSSAGTGQWQAQTPRKAKMKMAA